MTKIITYILLLQLPLITFGDASNLGSYALGFGYTYGWDDDEIIDDAHSVGLTGRVPVLSNLDILLSLGGGRSSSSLINNSEIQNYGSSFSPQLFHKFTISDSFVDSINLLASASIGVLDIRSEFSPFFSSTIIKSHSTRVDYSLGFAGEISIAEKLSLGLGFNFIDSLNQEVDDQINVLIGSNVYITENLYAGITYSRKLNKQYPYYNTLSVYTGYRW